MNIRTGLGARVGTVVLTLAGCSASPPGHGDLDDPPAAEGTGGSTGGTSTTDVDSGVDSGTGGTTDEPPDAQPDCVPHEDLDVVWNRDSAVPRVVRGFDLRLTAEDCAGARFEPETDAIRVAQGAVDALGPLYSLTDRDRFELVVADRYPDPLGSTHVHAAHRHGDDPVPVWGSQLLVHLSADGHVYEVGGHFQPVVGTIDTSPTLTPAQAIAVAQADMAAATPTATYHPSEPELFIDARGPRPLLVYALTLHGDDASAFRYLVDAHDGSVVLRYDAVPTLAPELLESILFDGLVDEPVEISGQRLAGEGGGLVTIPARRVPADDRHYLWDWQQRQWWVTDDDGDPFVGNPLFQTDADWGASDPFAISAAANASATYDYFCDQHQWCGMRNEPDSPFSNIVEVTLYRAGANPNGEVAFYSPGIDRIGVGQVAGFGSFATTDVLAHEYTHGVVSWSGNLQYLGEPGALNESFADIFGTLVEFHTQADDSGAYPGWSGGEADWLVGEDTGTLVRDMRDPSNPAVYARQSPSRYGGTHWLDPSGAFDSGGLHYNSGVQNYFFYLLVEGGAGVNDGLPYDVPGVGMDAAGRIAFRALAVYTSWNNDYADEREAWLSAAQDLSVADGVDYVGPVTAAWDAVGVSSALCPTWYVDGDGDGFGDPAAAPLLACSLPVGYANNADDCDDTNPNSYPGAPETCGDGVTNDCRLELCEQDYDPLPGCSEFATVCGGIESAVVDGEVHIIWSSDCPVQTSSDLQQWVDYAGPVQQDGCVRTIVIDPAVNPGPQLFRVRSPAWECWDEDLGSAVNASFERLLGVAERGLPTPCNWRGAQTRGFAQYSVRWQAPSSGTFQLQAAPGVGAEAFDEPDIHVRGGDCHGLTIACDSPAFDDVAGVQLEAVAGREYTIVMTGRYADADGNYVLTITEL